ncbi:hypothetical protein [Metabacillus sp. 84]|uniref:hypothetical protein n=1 Tax=unclassified Metabacillus TaxID=2675274 RepID=UPI003CFB7139
MYLFALSNPVKGLAAAPGMASTVYKNFLKAHSEPKLFKDLAEASYYDRTSHFPLYL